MAGMNGYSEWMQAQTMEWLFKQTPTQSGEFWYCGLSTTLLNPDGTGAVEVVGGDYARPQVESLIFGSPGTSSSKTTVINDVEIRYVESSQLWGTVLWFFMMDILTGVPASNPTSLLFGGELDVAKTIEAQTVAVFSPGDMAISTINAGI